MSKLSKKERKHAQKIFNDFLIKELRNVNKKLSDCERVQELLFSKLEGSRKIITELEELAPDLYEKFEELKGQYGGYNFGNRVTELEKFRKHIEMQINFCLKDLNGGMQPGDEKSIDSRVSELEKAIQDITTKDMQKSIDKLTSKRGRPKKVQK